MLPLLSRMGSPVGLLVRLLSVMLALVALLALSAAQATGAKAKGGTDPGCTWGASSVRAEVVDSRIVASEPTVTGCIP